MCKSNCRNNCQRCTKKARETNLQNPSKKGDSPRTPICGNPNYAGSSIEVHGITANNESIPFTTLSLKEKVNYFYCVRAKIEDSNGIGSNVELNEFSGVVTFERDYQTIDTVNYDEIVEHIQKDIESTIVVGAFKEIDLVLNLNRLI